MKSWAPTAAVVPGNDLVTAIESRVAEFPDQEVFLFLSDGETEAARFTYAEAWQKSLRIATFLRDRGARGELVLLLLPSGPEFFVSLFGCLQAGAVAIPAPPPHRERGLARIRSIIADSRPRIVLSNEPAPIDKDGNPDPMVADLIWCRPEDILAETDAVTGGFERPDPDSAAIIQYTSGSTGDPKGIIVTHANACSNILAQYEHTASPERPRLVSWLPVHHDLGLFANIIAAPVLGGRLALMPPTAFVQKPLRWLRAIGKYRAVRSGGPNFGFDLCVRALEREPLGDVDLSCWQTAFNAAEHVRPATLQAFARAFAPFGFRAETWYPSYGLAEATLIVSGAKRNHPPTVRTYLRDPMSAGRAVPVAEGDNGLPQTLVSCGPPIARHKLRIVSTQSGEALAEREIGEICFSGPSVSPGFWGRPEATREKFGLSLPGDGDDTFLRTGDLGFVDDGELYIVSRVDDLIVLRGRNIAPQDIEDAAQRSSISLVVGAAAFLEENDQVTVVVEVARDVRRDDDLDAVAAAARQAVWTATEVAVSRVVLVRPGSIPRTTSGKVRRRATRTALANGELRVARELSDDGAATTATEIVEVATEGLDAEMRAWLRDRLGLAALPDLHASPLQLGLDSLSAAELSIWIQLRYGQSVPYPDLLGDQSLGELLTRLAAVGYRPVTPGLTPDIVGTSASAGHRLHPLTRLQLAILAERARRPDDGSYNVPLALRLPRSVSDAQIVSAIGELARNHPGLRSRFEMLPEGPVRRVETESELPLVFEDLSGSDAETRVATMIALSTRPFPLEGQLLWRATVSRWDESHRFLVLTLHHLICDGLSIDWLGQELIASLAAPGQKSETAEPAEPAADSLDNVVAQEEAYLSSAQFGIDTEYWQSRLTPRPPPLTVPRRRHDSGSSVGASHVRRFALTRSQLLRLRAAAVAQGVSVPAYLLSLFALVLHRAMAQDDLVIGTITSVRDPIRHAGLLAPLINPVLVRSTLRDEAGSFRSFASSISRSLHDAFAHRMLPLSLLIDQLQWPASPEAAGLFQAAFGHVKVTEMAGSPEESLNLPVSDRIHPLLLHPQEGTNPLLLAWFESEDSCNGLLVGKDEWFSATTIDRLHAQIADLIGADPIPAERSLAEVSSLARDEYSLLETWSRSSRAVAAVEAEGSTIPALIAAIAARHPDRPAVIESDGTAWSYARLHAAAAAIRLQLQANGIKSGDAVLIHLDRSSTWLAAALAIMSLGAAFVPADPDQPLERTIFVAQDCNAALVLTQADPASLSVLARPSLRLDSDPGAGADGGLDGTATGLNDDLPAYILYTSGSTGQPKGVAVSHAALRERLLWKVEAFGMTELDRVLQSIPLLFDPSLWEMFTPLLCGAAVVLAPKRADRDPALLARLVRDHRVTLMSCVSGVLPHLADAFEATPAASLRRVITGGEALAIQSRRHFQTITGATVDHFYGPTEATIFCTHIAIPYDPLDKAAGGETGRVESIGRPVAGATVEIIDPRGRLQPLGTPGEIVIGGLGLANSYVGRSEETRLRFVVRDGTAGDRIYRTGDLGRWRDDGTLEIIGRLDDQIKLRGVRIEPAEIEGALLEISGIAEVAVAVEKRSTGDSLAAWIVAIEKPFDKATITDHLLRRLPRAFVPSVFYRIPELPRLPSGKVDKAALVSGTTVGLTEIGEQEDHEEPPGGPASNSLEAMLLRLWREALDAPDLRSTDDVFMFGAHSLMVMRVASLLRSRTGLTLPVDKVFDFRTPRRQSALLEQRADIRQGHHPTLICLSSKESRNNLVCILAGCGDRGRLERLAGELEGEIAVWALSPPDGPSPSGKWDLETLLDAYTALLASGMPGLTFTLAGFSAGGPIAVALAARRDLVGLSREQLVLFDCAHPVMPSASLQIYLILQNILRVAAWLPVLGKSRFVTRARRIFEDVGLYTHLSLLRQWKRAKIPGTISVIRGSGTRWLSGILFSPWRLRAERVRYQDSTGLHGALFDRPHIKALADALRRLLRHP